LGPEDKMAFRFDGGELRGAGGRPSHRRMMTNETGLTSVGSDVSQYSIKQNSMAQEERARSTSPIRAINEAATDGSISPIKAALRPTPFKAALQGSPSTSRLRTATSSSVLPRTQSPSQSLADLSADALSSSPKKGAKDLIRFYEQTSAPNSPQQSPTRKKPFTPTTASRQSKEALGSSAYENQPTTSLLGAETKSLHDKLDGQSSPLRQKARNRGWLPSASGAEELRSSSENEENMPSALRFGSQRKPSRQASGSFLKTGSTSIKSGVNRMVTALSPSGASDQEQTDQEDRQSIMSAHSIGTTRSYRQTTGEDDDLNLNPGSTIETTQLGALPLRTGFVYYFNVHASPAIWQWAQAVLLSSAIALSWIPAGGGRVSVVLDLVACREVHSVPGPDHPSSSEDAGAVVAREQKLNRICPWQLIFDDGVERMAVESAKDRVQWVNAIWDVLGSAHQATPAVESRKPAEHSTELEMMGEGGVTSIAAPKALRNYLNESAARVEDKSQPSSEEVLTPLPSKAERTRKAVNYSAVSTSTSPRRDSKPSVVDSVKADKDGESVNSAASVQSSTVSANLLKSPESIYVPRTPRSRAIFNWASVDESEIRPGDSASQRPARSQTNSSRYTAITRGIDSKETTTKRTVAQTIRDGVMSNMSGANESRKGSAIEVDTVCKDTLAVIPRSSNTTNRSMDSAKTVSSRGLPAPIKITSSPEKVEKKGSQEVSRMLQLVEEQQKEREQRDAYLQSQLQSFQQSLNDLSAANASRRKGRRSTSLGSSQAHQSDPTKGDNAITTVAADAAALLAMQEKLDKVLSLVDNVTRSKMNEGAPQGPEQIIASPSLTRIENTLQSLMTRIAPSPTFLANRMVKGTVPSTRRMSAPPNLEDEDGEDVFSTPMQNNYVDMPSSPSFAGDLHRSNSRSWYSNETPPAAPPNTLRVSHYAPSNLSLDMEAEIRRRRSRQIGGDFPGGWYTPTQSGQVNRQAADQVSAD
jgi:hypothetical protein